MQLALEQIVRTAVVDPTIAGGLTWPLGIDTGTAMTSTRYTVRSVRMGETVRTYSRGKVWKLRRVNGREVKMGAAGRLTNEIEFAPKRWKELLKEVSRRVLSLKKKKRFSRLTNEVELVPERWKPLVKKVSIV